ncbi:hypothetical protein BSKO_11608 [Bryopsis sp. KO-2023]|nr:hypothetical protein BSKO_11608 [Bryopsis sp. KO-2023]
MPYSKDAYEIGPLDASPSLLFNNLASSGEFLAYGRHKEVACVETATINNKETPTVSKVSSSASEEVHSVAYFNINGEVILGIASGMGLQVWNESGNRLIYHWILPSKNSPPPDAIYDKFARGMCITRGGDDLLLLCVGTSCGLIHVFNIETGPTFEHFLELEGHETAISSLGSTFKDSRQHTGADYLFSGEESGKIIVWECNPCGRFDIKHTISSNTPCVSMGGRGSNLVLGRLNGMIEIYSLVNGEKLAEICSHGRFLTALDMHPHKDLVATVSQDCTCCVWSIPFDSLEEIAPVFSTCWPHNMMTGVAFCGKDFDDVAVVAYDTEEIVIWKHHEVF